MRKSPDQMREGLNLALIKIGRELETTAKTEHKFTTRSGSLERSIGYKIFTRKGASFKAITLKFGLGFDPTKASASYEKAIHNGSKPHVILPKNGKALAFGGKVYKKVNHPGTKKDWFIYRAVKKNRPFINRTLDEAIKKVTKKV